MKKVINVKKKSPPAHTTDEKIRYIDLFCGLGAFHAAFNTSKHFECVLACDIDEGVRKIYEANYGLKPHGDIRKLDIPNMPDFDILCAGFPCQPFSIAGNGEGFKDTEKGNLFYDILHIIDGKNPKMCLLENVKNLKTHDDGRTYETIETELKKRGYLVTSRCCNAVDYGSPQARTRIFIVGTKMPFVIPEPTITSFTPVSAILDKNDDMPTASAANSRVKLHNYDLIEKKGISKPGKPHILYDLISKETGKGGRQGERVYDIDNVGITVCASSGGPGAKTGLYKVGDVIRRLSVRETLGMFGFSLD
ncbi:MAG: DNA cytosine methyltransferase, partial [Sphingomonadales bacterium]|nr:DNA cytosine methyltransferase [Sphingomonadales bacterium]